MDKQHTVSHLDWNITIDEMTELAFLMEDKDFQQRNLNPLPLREG